MRAVFPVLAALGLVLFASPAMSQSSIFCTDYGSAIYCDSALSALRSGNSLYFSDGSSAFFSGNGVYFSNGVSGFTSGNTTYFSNGDTAVRIGNIITVTTSPLAVAYRNEHVNDQQQSADDGYKAGYAIGYAIGSAIGNGVQARRNRHHCELDPYWSAWCGQKFNAIDKEKLQAGAWLANWKEIGIYLTDISDTDRATVINYLYSHPWEYRGTSTDKPKMYANLSNKLLHMTPSALDSSRLARRMAEVMSRKP